MTNLIVTLARTAAATPANRRWHPFASFLLAVLSGLALWAIVIALIYLLIPDA